VALARRSYSKAEEIALGTQVDGCCPVCGVDLFFEKTLKSKQRLFIAYELAHVYPLNPTPTEAEELKDVPRLSGDPNDPDNIIPLCTGCHTRFDKPRTREEYLEMFRLKSNLLERERQRVLMRQYPMEDAIRLIVNALGVAELSLADEDILSLDPRTVDEKCRPEVSELVIRKIKRNISDYYVFVQSQFRNLEQQMPNKSQLIFTQVRSFYMKQKELGLSKQDIYQNVVAWFRTVTQSEMIEAPEVIAAFFVQDCEVLE
jgi:hypothetical protein